MKSFKPRKEALTAKDLAKIKVMMRYEIARPLEQRIKVLERKVDYLNGKMMFNGVG